MLNYLKMLENEKELEDFLSWKGKEGTMRGSLKLMMDSMKNGTYYQIMKSDDQYQADVLEAHELEGEYDNLDLPADQKNLIDRLLTKRVEMDWDVAVHAYMAGLLDSYDLMKYKGLTKE